MAYDHNQIPGPPGSWPSDPAPICLPLGGSAKQVGCLSRKVQSLSWGLLVITLSGLQMSECLSAWVDSQTMVRGRETMIYLTHTREPGLLHGN